MLFLGGGGNEKKSKLLDTEFVASLPSNPRILYIPLAMSSNLHRKCYEWITKAFHKFGITNIEMWCDLREKMWRDVKEFDAIYIGGGNTFRLMKILRETNFVKILKKFSKKKPIYGGSAGAIILGKDIRTAQDKNYVKIKNFSGLNLVFNYSIWCHYKRPHDLLIKDFVKRISPVIAIPEDGGVVVKSSKITSVGFSSCYIIQENMWFELKPNMSYRVV
jgi:dipeptidase E